MGFNPSRYDPDVWMRKCDDNKGYDYISTHVDDFLITAKDPDVYMNYLQTIYTIKNPTIPDYYLGANYVGNVNTNRFITARPYIKEAILQIEKKLQIMLREEKTPMRNKDHPEEDTSPLLDSIMHTEYQSLIGMLQWLVTLCRIDIICYAVSSLSRFNATPREGHFSRVLLIWGYLKKYSHRALKIDNEKFALLVALGNDSSWISKINIHMHQRRLKNSSQSHWVTNNLEPKRQGAVQTSTYGAELCSMRAAIEGAISVRFMLRSFVIKVSKPCTTLGDNEATIVNTSAASSPLRKKHVALSYHFIRENSAVGTICPAKISGKDNFADLLTKPLERNTFMKHTGSVLSLEANPLESVEENKMSKSYP
jgi:hypothetical protein